LAGIPRDRLSGAAAVGLAAVSWGTWSLFLRPTGLPATTTTPLVFLGMAVAAVPFMLRAAAPQRWDTATALLVLLHGTLNAANVLAFFAALSTTTVAIAVLTHYLAPVLVALFSPLIEKVRVRGAVIAAVVATAGLTLVLEPWSSAQRGGDPLVGGLLGAASAAAYAASVFVARVLSLRISAARVMGLHAMVAGLLTLPLAIGGLAAVDGHDLALLGGGAIGPGTLAGIFFLGGLVRIGAARAAVITFLEPLVAVAVGWLAFAEPLSWTAAAGGVLILGAALHGATADRVPSRREPGTRSP